MELLKYSKRGQTAPNASFTETTEKWFGCKSFLQHEINKGFQDNSLGKESSRRIRMRKKYEKLRKDLTVVQDKANKIRRIRQRLRLQANGFKIVKEMNDDSSELSLKMNQAAVLIQKIVRGFLTRRDTAGKLVEVYRKSVNCQLEKINQNNVFCLFFVGKEAKKSAIVIQRFFRRVLLRRKLQKMEQFYGTVLKAREIHKAQKLRPIFLVLFNKLHLKEAQVSHDFHSKLWNIRKKLAILQIKSILKRKKIKIKSIKHRIRRFTKKSTMANNSWTNHTMTQSPHISDKNILPNDSKPSTILIHDEPVGASIVQVQHEKSIDNFSLSTEYLAAQEALKKERIEKGKITYNVKVKPPSLILPLFQDYDPDSRPQTTRSTMNRTILVNPLRIVPETTPRQKVRTNAFFFTPRTRQVKKYREDEEPPYMNDTKNSIMRYEESPSPELKVKPRALSMNSRVLSQTYSSSQKMKLQDFETPKKKPNNSRPSTGPQLLRRRVRSKPHSCANIIEYCFDPPANEITDLESLNFRPFYARVRPALEKLKVNHSRYFSQY